MTQVLFIPLYQQSNLRLFAKLRQPEVFCNRISELLDSFTAFGQAIKEATGVWPRILGADLPDSICHIDWRSTSNCPVWLVNPEHQPVVIDEDLVADTSVRYTGIPTNVCFQLFCRQDRVPYIRLECSAGNANNGWCSSGGVPVSLLRFLASGRLNELGDAEVAALFIPRRSTDANRNHQEPVRSPRDGNHPRRHYGGSYLSDREEFGPQ